MSFKKKNITSFSALLISVVTLILFLFQTRLQYNQSRFSVVPKLTFNIDYASTIKHTINQFNDTMTVEKVDFTLHLINKGLGPAIIKKLDYEHNNKKIDINNFKVNNKEVNDIFTIIYASEVSDGAILSKNENLKLFTLSLDKEKFYQLQKEDKIEKLEKIINVSAEYESMYQEPFFVKLHNNSK